MAIVNATRNTIIALKINLADNPLSRLVGLLKKSSLPKDGALVITPANCIHSFFMRFNIDLIFLDKQNKVVGVVENLKPFRVTRIFFRAHSVIELPAGRISETGTSLQDEISIER